MIVVCETCLSLYDVTQYDVCPECGGEDVFGMDESEIKAECKECRTFHNSGFELVIGEGKIICKSCGSDKLVAIEPESGWY